MTETTYDIITKSLDRISKELHTADENNDFSRICLLSGQLRAIKENLQRLLWIELPELNETQKLKGLSQNTTGMIFNPGIFEFDAMRQAFFKRQAMSFFETEEEQQAYIAYTEEQYLSATVNLKEIYFKVNHTQPKMTHREKMEQVKSEFAEAMK
ncbi:TPA: hypothetical protein U0921_002001 [Streptococcus suis]|uniref:hypothetical protein n=1 Tax=Streptococcus suis TaxID=1307 RepID=UPI000414F147|nr:hypothetical protein [Streptococcus suis]HEM3174192.1 hypothetical protein [Streptococcus suis]HEM4060704.1 hypothetical protein [Streptococcus suis]HEP1791676.1 hypothetical protein [Streptococcus suis]HEP1796246.1 hypothetical protein [Streptococcus suis]